MKFFRNIGLATVLTLAMSVCAFAQNVTVNPGAGSYPTLADAFTAINNGTHTGAITVSIVGNSFQTSAVLNASGTGAASYTSILITPVGARTIGGGGSGYPTINLNGADNVTINGLNTGGNSLTFTNSSTSSFDETTTIWFHGSATNNTITNCTILGSSTATSINNDTGTILFGPGDNGSGNNNNVISNNNIGPVGTNLPTRAIRGNGNTSTPAEYNSGIQITGNNIYDFFNAAAESNGVYLVTGNTDWTISGNRFYQTATRTQTTGAIHSAIQIASSLGNNNHSISNNIIGYSSATGTGTYDFVGASSTSKFIPIYFSSAGTTTASSVQGNVITCINVSGVVSGFNTTGAFVGISVASGLVNIGNAAGNTIGSLTAAGAISITTNVNSIVDVYGINYDGNSGASISNNRVGGIVASNSGVTGIDVSGIRAETSSSSPITAMSGNTIGSQAAPISLSSPSVSSSNLYGLVCQAKPCVVTGNTISNLTTDAPNVGTAANASIIGLWINEATSPNADVSQNVIFNIANTNATAAVWATGLHYNGYGASFGLSVVERNYINAVSAPNNAATVNGIFVENGRTQFQNNAIVLGNDILANSPQINGILETDENTTDITKSNFYFNSVNIGGVGVSSGSASSFAFNSTVLYDSRYYRNNIFLNRRSNGAGATGRHFAISVGGAAANPPGLTSDNNDLIASGTGGALGLFNGAIRQTLAGWQAATGQDANSLSVLPQFVSNADLHLNAGSPVRDQGVHVGVFNDADGGTRPGANNLFDIGADEFDGGAAQANDIQATAFVSPLHNSTVPVGSVVTPQATFTNVGTTTQNNITVRFRIVFLFGGTEIYNQTTTISSLAPGASATVTFPNASITTAATYTMTAKAELAGDTVTGNDQITGTFVARNGLSGNFYTVGSNGDFPSLTNPDGIFQDINNFGLAGNITINIISDLTSETGAVGLNENAGGFSVLIRPRFAPRIVSGSSNFTLLRFDGTDNVTLDGSLSGGTDRSLTITNIYSFNDGVIRFISGANGAQNNVVKNLNVSGGGVNPTATYFGIAFGGSAAGSFGANNDNNRIENNSIQSAAYGIFSFGQNAANKNTGNVIIGNTMTGIGANSIESTGIYAVYEDGIQIVGNNISGVNSTLTSDYPAIGIAVGTAYVEAGTGATFEVSNAIVSRNYIGTVAGDDNPAAGIALGASATGTNRVDNNMITGVTSRNISSGIYVGTVAGGIQNIYYNSVSMSGNRGTVFGQSGSFALAVAGTDQPVNVLNNALVNNQTSSNSAATSRSYAVGVGYSTFANLNSNNNDLFVTGAEGRIGITGNLVNPSGTERTTLANWRTATGKDAASVSIDPLFISTTDLHLQPFSPVQAAATVIAGINYDYDLHMRGNVPDIGADELLAATAAGVSIAGRVFAGKDRGLTNARVYLTDAAGETQMAMTGSSGYYRFADVGAGQTVVITVVSKRYNFAPQVVNVTEDIGELNFIASFKKQ